MKMPMTVIIYVTTQSWRLQVMRMPIVGEELLASQPTMSRLENQVTTEELAAIRRLFVEKFIQSHRQAPEEIILDVDGWDAQTYGAQQLSMFHGYYGHKMYYPVLINEASSGYPLILQLRAGNSHSGKGIAGIQRMVILATEKSLAPSTNYLARRCGIFATWADQTLWT